MRASVRGLCPCERGSGWEWECALSGAGGRGDGKAAKGADSSGEDQLYENGVIRAVIVEKCAVLSPDRWPLGLGPHSGPASRGQRDARSAKRYWVI